MTKSEAKKRVKSALENWRELRGTPAESAAWNAYLYALGYYHSFD